VTLPSQIYRPTVDPNFWPKDDRATLSDCADGCGSWLKWRMGVEKLGF